MALGDYNPETAIEAFKRAEYEAVFAYCLPHADGGNTSAQCMVSLLYQSGLGVGRDFRKAEEWLMKAVGQNDALAWNNLATLYASGGEGLSKGPESARECYLQAKELGFSCGEPYPPGG